MMTMAPKACELSSQSKPEVSLFLAAGIGVVGERLRVLDSKVLDSELYRPGTASYISFYPFYIRH